MLNAVTEMIPNVLNCVFSFVFITYINDSRIRSRKQVFTFAVMLLLEITACLISVYPFPYIMLYLLQLVIPFLYSVLTFGNLNFFRKIIPAFAYFVSFMITELFSSMITATFCQATLIDAVFSSGNIRIIHLLISKTMLFIFLAVLLLMYKKLFRIIKRKIIYYLLMIFPAASLLMILISGAFCEMENYYIVTVCITAVSTLAVYYMIYRVWLNNKAEAEKELYMNMLEMQSRRYDDIKKSSQQISKIKHDIKNMLISVKFEVDSSNVESARRKLDSILDRVNSIDSFVKSGNKTIDYIINAKLCGLESRQIKVSGSISEIERIKDIDLSIILGNILDNAVEGTENVDNAVIELRFFDKGNYHNIICRNTINRSVLSDNPSLRTKKHHKSYHGFGIKSVKEIVLNCNGMINFYEEDHMFCVHIMLPIEQA